MVLFNVFIIELSLSFIILFYVIVIYITRLNLVTQEQLEKNYKKKISENSVVSRNYQSTLQKVVKHTHIRTHVTHHHDETAKHT